MNTVTILLDEKTIDLLRQVVTRFNVDEDTAIRISLAVALEEGALPSGSSARGTCTARFASARPKRRATTTDSGE